MPVHLSKTDKVRQSDSEIAGHNASCGTDVGMRDGDAGDCLMTLMQDLNGEAAAIDHAKYKALWASEGAWGFLGWRVWDEDRAFWRALPLEIVTGIPVLTPGRGPDTELVAR